MTLIKNLFVDGSAGREARKEELQQMAATGPLTACRKKTERLWSLRVPESVVQMLSTGKV
jgi:hypothetical protein